MLSQTTYEYDNNAVYVVPALGKIASAKLSGDARSPTEFFYRDASTQWRATDLKVEAHVAHTKVATWRQNAASYQHINTGLVCGWGYG